MSEPKANSLSSVQRVTRLAYLEVPIGIGPGSADKRCWMPSHMVPELLVSLSGIILGSYDSST